MNGLFVGLSKTVRIGAVVSLVGIALLYHGISRRREVGYYSDEARYILAAQSLVQGHYVDLRNPRHPATNHPPPGFPLLLAPFVDGVAPRWHRLRIIPSFLLLSSALLMFVICAPSLGATVSAAASILFLGNPAVVDLSGSILSEPYFAFLMLLSLWLVRSCLGEDRAERWILLGLVLAMAGWVRQEGVLLGFSVAYVLRDRMNRRRGLSLSLPMLILWGGLALRNSRTTHQAVAVGGYWLNLLGSFQERPPRFFFSYAREFLRMFLGLALWGRTDAALTAIALVLIGFGLARFIQGSSEEAAVFRIAGLFGGLYLGVHAAWLYLEPRFFLPLIPLALACMLKGVQPWGKRAMGGLILLLAFLYARADYAALFHAEASPLPQATFRWIKEHLSPTDIIDTSASEVVFLYSGKFTRESQPPAEPEELRFRLTQAGSSHILYQRFAQLEAEVPGAPTAHDAWARSEREMRLWHSGFDLVYENAGEGTTLYAVRPDSRLGAAWKAYFNAMDEIRRSHWEQALVQLDEALKQEPDLTVALNAYAVTCLFDGKPSGKARLGLVRALKIRPSYLLARENLTRIDDSLKIRAAAK